jgi:hypothetical protein
MLSEIAGRRFFLAVKTVETVQYLPAKLAHPVETG